MSSRNCPSCGAPVSVDTTDCKYCGEKIAVAQPQQQGQQYSQSQQPPYAPSQQPQYAPPGYNPYANYNRKSKVTAGVLGILLGGLGIHKFYLGRIGWGIVYLIFCWTYIPALLGVIEGIIYLSSSDEKFHMKYSRK
ncbi:NINE protein [Paenibacillus paridis]|uniref:NINE protein n=1 Tax=Paenibacillus paridis TaxID=2583376 RepID=UPI00111F9789|nr:NINE protein [Paenibacillus paridis]